jgi:hypothetical protein
LLASHRRTEEEVMASAAMASWREEDPEVSYVLIDRSIYRHLSP